MSSEGSRAAFDAYFGPIRQAFDAEMLPAQLKYEESVESAAAEYRKAYCAAAVKVYGDPVKTDIHPPNPPPINSFDRCSARW